MGKEIDQARHDLGIVDEQSKPNISSQKLKWRGGREMILKSGSKRLGSSEMGRAEYRMEADGESDGSSAEASSNEETSLLSQSDRLRTASFNPAP
ncbi:uncharacterized protein A4U43_C01F12080 [Asparagus officinalis]|uniref:Uncharacterized protein n=1 Tax=Asparagus officinalis TaxID=4686 RepID=A0A5P1FQE3_ASPOF|nr:uncharacterized protein A4U43_C01F12080 [Asparagus officinalis]